MKHCRLRKSSHVKSFLIEFFPIFRPVFVTTVWVSNIPLKTEGCSHFGEHDHFDPGHQIFLDHHSYHGQLRRNSALQATLAPPSETTEWLRLHPSQSHRVISVTSQSINSIWWKLFLHHSRAEWSVFLHWGDGSLWLVACCSSSNSSLAAPSCSITSGYVKKKKCCSVFVYEGCFLINEPWFNLSNNETSQQAAFLICMMCKSA